MHELVFIYNILKYYTTIVLSRFSSSSSSPPPRPHPCLSPPLPPRPRPCLLQDVETLKQKSLTTLCLATLPCSVEATVAASLLRVLHPPASWAFCFCLGFVLSSVSPAVVVPSLVALQDDGYGGWVINIAAR
jgi:hypothetical protein